MMSSLFPSSTILQSCLSSSSPLQRKAAPRPSPSADDFPIWSAVDDVKSKAGQLSDEAQKELQKASSSAQAKAGPIELYSGKYYAACTLGGILACVGLHCLHLVRHRVLTTAGPDSH